MRWTCGRAKDERSRCGRQRCVVLISRRWDQVRGRVHGRGGLTSPVPRGEHGAAVKTIARGMPDCFGVPVVTNSYAFHFAYEAAGARCIRHSLRPQFPRAIVAKLG